MKINDQEFYELRIPEGASKEVLFVGSECTLSLECLDDDLYNGFRSLLKTAHDNQFKEALEQGLQGFTLGPKSSLDNASK